MYAAAKAFMVLYQLSLVMNVDHYQQNCHSQRMSYKFDVKEEFTSMNLERTSVSIQIQQYAFSP